MYLRILPHHQDTGGFFVAVLKKLAPWSSAEAVQRDETKTAEGENDIQASASPPKKKKRFYGYKEDPFIYFEKGEPVWKEQIQKFYGIKDSFDETLLLVRTREGKKRNVYLTTAAVKELVTDNEDKIKGAYVVGPFLHDRVISVCDQDAIQLLMGSDLDNPPQIHTLNPTTQEKLNQIETGSVALVYEADVEEEDKLSLYMVGWKGKASLKVYISKNDRVHFLRLIGADTSKFENDKIEDKFCGSKDDEDQGSVGNGDNQNDAD
ncbi:unnamed protein product [Darwinula stevensoni]|uniref:SAM-dependent MTase RsmB/NOP-type domain-containing protein n=1 Tax=Darwinula stevensoni TaxID=69355 RepID=A0A7R9ACJ3_9CRUS|nr:unnamed protein product [Darwinula stevensoni]CAG0900422.1 unnamed protein product [Darwinula stevensoni]